jgi:uncharacterized protein DUF6912
MRVYVPLTMTALRAAFSDGEVPCAVAYAVTPGLREWYAEGDQEELEYVALTAAARDSLRMLAENPAAPRRRVVLAADVDGAQPRDVEERGTVTLTGPIPWRNVAAGHVDDPDAADDVAAAAQAVGAADGGDEDAAFTVDSAEAHELQWYATQELPGLL